MSAARSKKRANRSNLPPRETGGGDSSPASAPPTEFGFAGLRLKSVFSGRFLWVSLALVVATAAVYYPVWNFDFVNYDDPQYIYENPNVLGGLTWSAVRWAFTSGYAFYWHPLTWLSLLLDVDLFGLHAGAFHVHNVLLHTANSILLFALLYGMTGARGRSAFVALMFAIHPLHVESVAWVTERKDVLSTLFWMLAVAAYVRYAREPRRTKRAAVALLFALGLMAKPMLVTLPFLLLLLDYWPLRRISLAAKTKGSGGSVVSSKWPSAGLPLLVEKLPLFFLAAASSVVTYIVQRQSGAAPGLDLFPLKLRIENALVGYVTYIGQMFWPMHLAAHYPYDWSPQGWWVAGSALVLIGISVAVMRAAQHHPYLPVGWLWYLGTMVPVIGLVQSGSQSTADHFTYVPLIGLFIMVAWGVPDLLPRRPYRRVVLPSVAAVVIAACLIAARVQVSYWENSITLWQHALGVTSGNFLAHTNLGIALSKQGQVSEAIAHYEEALRIRPNYELAHNDLANALYTQGKLGEAIVHYREALDTRPDFAEAHNGLGAALTAAGQANESIAHFVEAARLQPVYPEAHNNWGNALSRLGRNAEAVEQYREAIRLKPAYAEAHANLGAALAAQGRNGDSIREFLEAVRIDPLRAEFHYNAALMYDRMAKAAEAIEQYDAVVRLKPDFAVAHYGWGLALLRQGKKEEAARHFETALRLNPAFGEARRALDELARPEANNGTNNAPGIR